MGRSEAAGPAALPAAVRIRAMGQIQASVRSARLVQSGGAVANRLASAGGRNRGMAGHGVGYRDGGT